MKVIKGAHHYFDFHQFDLCLSTTVSDVETSKQSSEGEKTDFSSSASAGFKNRKFLSFSRSF